MITPSSRSPFRLRRLRDSKLFVFFHSPLSSVVCCGCDLGFSCFVIVITPTKPFFPDIHVTDHSRLYAYHPVRIVYVAGFNPSVLSPLDVRLRRHD